MTLRTVALVKQVPKGDRPLGADARLARDGAEAEMNPWCRRAVAQAVRLGRCTAVTMGPPAAADVLRESAAWGAERTVHLSDPALAGADCLVTARALGDVVGKLGDVDVVLVGHSSTDGSTGAVGPMLAEVLGLPFVGPAMEIDVEGSTLRTRLQVEGGTETVAVHLPAVVAVAERSCQPAKVAPGSWAPADVVERWSAADLKEDIGPSPTAVVGMRHAPRHRGQSRLDGDLAAQVSLAVAALELDVPSAAPEPVPTGGDRDVLVVGGNRALLGEAATLGRVTCVGGDGRADWGADEHIALGGREPRQVAAALAGRLRRLPWAILGGSTAWDREVLARLAVLLDAGLMSDLVGIEVRGDRLVGLKPTGGGMVAEIVGNGPTQIATLRTGTLAPRTPRAAVTVPRSELAVAVDPDVTRDGFVPDDDYDALDRAAVVVGVGRGVPPDEYGALEPLLTVLGAELGATRKVTDAGWLPHSRQIGLTARSIAPRLYVAIGLSGNPNHSVGVSRAHTVLAVNSDPAAPIFEHADIGIVGDWRAVVPLLTAALAARQPAS